MELWLGVCMRCGGVSLDVDTEDDAIARDDGAGTTESIVSQNCQNIFLVILEIACVIFVNKSSLIQLEHASRHSVFIWFPLDRSIR